MPSDRVIHILQCTGCKNKNYHYARGKREQDRSKLEIKKFCRGCGKHTPHKETKA